MLAQVRVSFEMPLGFVLGVHVSAPCVAFFCAVVAERIMGHFSPFRWFERGEFLANGRLNILLALNLYLYIFLILCADVSVCEDAWRIQQLVFLVQPSSTEIACNGGSFA